MKVAAATIIFSCSHLGLMELGSRAGTLLGGGKCSGRAGEEGSNGELHLVVIGSMRSNCGLLCRAPSNEMLGSVPPAGG